MIAINSIFVLANLWASYSLIRNYSRVAVFLAFWLFFQNWSLLSCWYNDLGIYNIELYRMTETTLATTRLAVFSLIFNAGIWLFLRAVGDRRLKRRDYRLSSGSIQLGDMRILGWIAVAAVIVYVSYTFWVDGIPIMQGLQRLEFFREAGVLDRIIAAYGFLIAFLLGYFRKDGKKITVQGLLLALMILYSVMVGNKFSGILRLAVPYYSAVYVRHLLKNPGFNLVSRRNMIYLVSLAVCLLGVAYVSYLYLGQDSELAFRVLRDRVLAWQGHLWWATDYNLFVNGLFDSNHWMVELKALLAGGEFASDTGMRYVMVQALGPEIAYPIIDNGYLYTMAYPAILVLTVPYPIAMVIQLTAGIFLGAAIFYLDWAIRYRHAVRAVVTISIIMPFLSTLGSGDFSAFLTLGIVVKLFFLAVLESGLVASGKTHLSANGAKAEI